MTIHICALSPSDTTGLKDKVKPDTLYIVDEEYWPFPPRAGERPKHGFFIRDDDGHLRSGLWSDGDYKRIQVDTDRLRIKIPEPEQGRPLVYGIAPAEWPGAKSIVTSNKAYRILEEMTHPANEPYDQKNDQFSIIADDGKKMVATWEETNFRRVEIELPDWMFPHTIPNELDAGLTPPPPKRGGGPIATTSTTADKELQHRAIAAELYARAFAAATGPRYSPSVCASFARMAVQDFTALMEGR